MKTYYVILSVLLAASAHAGSPNLVTNPSFEDFNAQGIPVGWRIIFTQGGASEAAKPRCVTDGKERENTHSGSAALEFVIPPGSVPPEGCTWSFDPTISGIDIEPGSYTASFWVKTVHACEKLQFELWDANVPVEEYASGAQGIASKLLETGDIPPDKWVKVELPFSVSRSGVRLAVSFHLKDAAPDSLVFIDDLEVVKD